MTSIADSPTRAIFWTGGMTPARAVYEFKVVELALELSVEKFGPYTLEIHAGRLTNQRVERAMLEGVVINIASSPLWVMREGEASPLTIIPISVNKGLLGYRQCIVRKSDLPRFAKVKTFADLQKLTAGLGTTWTELDVFRDSNLPWLGGREIEQLHLMLARSRFDYLPLGLVEAEPTLAESAYREELTIAPNLLIYYPLPVFIQVSVSQPKLAERLEYGLRRSISDGSLDKLFNQQYGELVETIQSAEMRVIPLKNPHLPPGFIDEGPTLVQPNRPPAANHSSSAL